AVPMYEGALEVVFALQQETLAEDYTEAAFRFMEKSKSVLLLSSLKENQARMAANMPDSLLQRENELRADLAYRQRQLVDRELEYGTNDSLAQVQRQQLLRRQQAYQALIGELEKDYPNYHREKYNTAVVRLDTFRQHLAGQGQSLVEYFVGARHWYYLALSATGQQFGRLADPDGLTMAVSDCLEAIHAPERGEASLREYARLGQELYDQLWSPMTANLQPRTVVVPAGILGYLPFEALLREAVGDASLRDFPFLLRDYQLSYAYSATVLMENHRSPVRRAAESVLAMAPVFADDPAWATLPYSQEEVEHIHRLVGGEMVVAEEATKAYFQAHGPAYRILHLSSHAAADSSGAGSWIAFAGPTDQQLFLPELYAMDLPADLAVLSACETGLGRISGGEGVMSLARGFAFAGCQSVITTLWKVNHGATAQIMTQLYEGLAAGATKDDALRQAQLTYLDDPTLDDIGRHPYYWSAFHQIGNANAIQLERRHPYLWWSLGGILLLLAALWLLRRRV
ncbi:MAG: CHAT domain-containing protein, partial [Lewinella sp.]|nr:CHAT domain-containing protein [Lewinella sp.]